MSIKKWNIIDNWISSDVLVENYDPKSKGTEIGQIDNIKLNPGRMTVSGNESKKALLYGTYTITHLSVPANINGREIVLDTKEAANDASVKYLLYLLDQITYDPSNLLTGNFSGSIPTLFALGSLTTESGRKSLEKRMSDRGAKTNAIDLEPIFKQWGYESITEKKKRHKREQKRERERRQQGGYYNKYKDYKERYLNLQSYLYGV